MGGCALWTQACVRLWPAVGGRGPKDDSGWPPYRQWSPLLSARRHPARYHTCTALLSGPLWGWGPSGGEDLVERPRPSGGGKSASRRGVGCGPGLRMDRITEASSRPDGGFTITVKFRGPTSPSVSPRAEPLPAVCCPEASSRPLRVSQAPLTASATGVSILLSGSQGPPKPYLVGGGECHSWLLVTPSCFTVSSHS